MSQRTASRKCKHCKERRMVVMQAPNHILHLLLSIVTAGIWLIPWILMIFVPRSFRCSVCGSRC